MSRLIDADALRELFAETISAIAKRPEMNGNLEYMIRSSAMAIKMIDDQPTIDAVPVVHGHWIDTGSGQECSVCGEIQYGYDSGRFFCQNCGAKMDAIAKDINVRYKSDEVTE